MCVLFVYVCNSIHARCAGCIPMRYIKDAISITQNNDDICSITHRNISSDTNCQAPVNFNIIGHNHNFYIIKLPFYV